MSSDSSPLRAVVVELHLGARAARLAVLLVAVEIHRRGGVRHREEIAVAGAHAERPVVARWRAEADMAALVDPLPVARLEHAEAAVAVPPARRLVAQLLVEGAAAPDLPAENLLQYVAAALQAARQAALGRAVVAAAIGVERRHDPGTRFARSAAERHLRALALQRVEIALHLLDLGVDRAAFGVAAAEQREAAARCPRSLAGELQLLALAADRGVLLADLRRYRRPAIGGGKIGLELAADPRIRGKRRRGRARQRGTERDQGHDPSQAQWSGSHLSNPEP